MKWWERARVTLDLTEGKDAADAMRAAEDRWPEVRSLAAELKRQGRANHFRQRFQHEFERARTEKG